MDNSVPIDYGLQGDGQFFHVVHTPYEDDGILSKGNTPLREP